MRHRPARDEGSVLIMALVFMTATAVILGAVLTMAQTTQRTTMALRQEANASQVVDGAVQQVVNTLQRGTFINEDGEPCFTAAEAGTPAGTNTMVIPDPDGTGSIAVVCEGTPGSGVMAPDVPITSVNKPGNAILTLGSTEGVYLNSDYDFFNRFDVGGPVFSNGPIATNGRSLTAREYVIARKACSDEAKISPTAQCNFGPTFHPGGVDPNYDTLLPSVPAYQTVPAVPNCYLGIFSTVTFQPGYYDDAAALNAVTSRGCAYHFKPGNYYFDFHNGDNPALPDNAGLCPATPSRPTGPACPHEWRVTSGRLIAGTRPSTFSQECVSPLKSTAANTGVRFVFGGNSRLTVDGGSAAICGQYKSDQPAIAFHGVKTGAEATATAKLAPSEDLVDSSDSKDWKFTRNPGGQKSKAWEGVTVADDSVSAQWTGANNDEAHLKLTRYRPDAAVVAGSVIDTATVRLRFKNGTARDADTRRVVLSYGGESCTLTGIDDTPAPGNQPPSTLMTQNLDVLSECDDSADELKLVAALRKLHDTGLSTTATNGPTLQYDVVLDRAGTETLDQLTLEVTYRAPAYRSQQTGVTGNSCVLGAAYIPSFAPGGPTGCAALDLHSNLFSIFRSNSTAINGTVYTPHASISVQMDAVSLSALRSGVISRSLYLQTTGILTFASVASIPFSSQGTDPSAYLTAYVCETASTCSPTTGVRKIRAKVTLVGQDTSVRRAAKIPSFSVQQ